MVVHAWVVPQTVQLSNDKGGILVCLMPNSQEDATLGFKYNHVKLQAQPLCMFIKNKKKKSQGKDLAPWRKKPLPSRRTDRTKAHIGTPVLGGGVDGGGGWRPADPQVVWPDHQSMSSKSNERVPQKLK